MRKLQIILIFMLLGLSGTVLAQPREKDSVQSSTDSTYMVIVDVEPTFKGGVNRLFEWLDENLKYPQEAKDANVEGTVYVQFVVERDGSISNLEIKQGVDPILDSAALKVVRTMPKWNPAKYKGKPIRCSLVLPIQFKLTEAEKTK